MITLHNCAPTSMMSQRMQFLARVVRFSELSVDVGLETHVVPNAAKPVDVQSSWIVESVGSHMTTGLICLSSKRVENRE
ncbi:unnamed protein product [Prunus brigantina]